MFLTCRNAFPSSEMAVWLGAGGTSRSCSSSAILLSPTGMAMVRKI